MDKIYHLVENVLPAGRCQELAQKFITDADPNFDARFGYHHYGLRVQDMRDPLATEYEDLKTVIELAYRHFLASYGMAYNTFELKRLFGNVMTAGAVNEPHDDDGDIYPDKPDIEEHYSCVLMLNSDYEGGELFFEHHDIELKLKAGDLIMFRGNAANLHGVREVLSGNRANIIIFFRNVHRDVPVESDSPYLY